MLLKDATLVENSTQNVNNSFTVSVYNVLGLLIEFVSSTET